MNKSDIQKLIPFITKEGKELVAKQGTIKDIGIKKQYLTQEDIEMERGIKKIIDSFEGENYFYSEEENDNFISGQSVWICDPISGTKLFLEGKSHYAVVLAHLNNGVTDFAIVYDPSSDALFKSDGIYATMNGHKIKPSDRSKNKVIFAPSYGWMDLEKRDKLEGLLKNDYEVFPSQGSMALNYCLVAKGDFEGVVSLTKDAFPEFAGLHIANRSGAVATNILGDENIAPDDRVFICGSNKEIYNQLLAKTKSVLT